MVQNTCKDKKAVAQGSFKGATSLENHDCQQMKNLSTNEEFGEKRKIFDKWTIS